MRIGNMDRLIGVYKHIPAPDPDGTWPPPEESWEYEQSVWMAKKPLRADEKFEINQRYAEIIVRFNGYWIDGLSEEDRLRDEDGHWFDIKAIAEMGYREGVEIDAQQMTWLP